MITPQASNVASTARAFATFSLVPYLGILFCPGAVLVGSFGIIKYFRSEAPVGIKARNVCYLSVLVGVLILLLQLLLWWILYKVPIWTRGF